MKQRMPRQRCPQCPRDNQSKLPLGQRHVNVKERPARGAGAFHNGSCPSIINTAPPCPTCSNVKSWPLGSTEQDSKMGEWAAQTILPQDPCLGQLWTCSNSWKSLCFRHLWPLGTTPFQHTCHFAASIGSSPGISPWEAVEWSGRGWARWQ